MNLDLSDLPELVIFDMDGVLCELDDDKRIAFMVTRSALSAEAIAAAIWGSGFEAESDRGAFDADAYLLEFGRRTQCAVSHLDWVAYRRSGMTPIVASLEFAREVAARTTVALLTNNGLQLKRAIDEVFPELRAIFGPKIFVSAEFGTSKPDPAIFEALCARLGIAPSQAMMIDDRTENIDGARAAGLRGHVFVAPDIS